MPQRQGGSALPPATGSPVLETHMMYSSLFSSVTRMLSPPSFSSWVVTLPRISMSWMKYSSRPHSSRLFSLGARDTKREEVYLRRVFPYPAPSLTLVFVGCKDSQVAEVQNSARDLSLRHRVNSRAALQGNLGAVHLHKHLHSL